MHHYDCVARRRRCVNCKITSNTFGVLVRWEIEMSKLASKSRQRNCTVFIKFRDHHNDIFTGHM